MRRVETPEIYSDLRHKLTTAAFRPGERLRPAALQQDYGCSANTVRDVLLLLSKDGLVEFALQRGFRVPETSTERCHDITTFRILLEQEGASLSIASGDLDWEARLSAAHHQLSHIESKIAQSETLGAYSDLWAKAEEAFHMTLISACGSPMLLTTYETVYVQFRQQLVGLNRHFATSYFGTIVVGHQMIVDAALSRNAEACRAAIYDHLKRHL